MKNQSQTLAKRVTKKTVERLAMLGADKTQEIIRNSNAGLTDALTVAIDWLYQTYPWPMMSVERNVLRDKISFLVTLRAVFKRKGIAHEERKADKTVG